MNTLSDVKSMAKYWLHFVFLAAEDKNKTVYLLDMVQQE